MSSQATISAIIGIVVLIPTIYLIARYAPRRRFPGWRVMLAVVLLVVVATMLILVFRGPVSVK